MRISSFSNLLSFYLTGSFRAITCNGSTEFNKLTTQELDDCEMSEREYEDSEQNGFKFSNQTLNLKANLNTVSGQFRFAGMGVINSLFSGIGGYIASKMSFSCGIALAFASFGASLVKKIPVLSTKFSIFTLGANSLRGTLHILDSIFSRVGEKASKYTLPSIFAGGVSLFSIFRSAKNKDNKSLELPNDTIAGILGRTSIHHLDSMLASKATELSIKSSEVGAFLASSLTTLGLLQPQNLRTNKMPWNTLEGFIAQGSSKFLDSLFASIGNAFSSKLDTVKKISLGTLGVAAGMPILGTILNSVNYQIPFGTIEGRLVKSILNAPETLAFNLGSSLGNSLIGLPLSLGFAGLTYLTCFSKSGKDLIKNPEISSTSLGGELQRLPLLHLMYSTISASAVKIADLIPAPLLTLFGPMLSFQLGERFKNIPAKFNDLKGLMIRNSIHIWDSILTRGAYKTATMFTKSNSDEHFTGNVLSDGGNTRWLTEDGRIVPNMAIGKQLNECKETNLLNILFSSLGGIGFAVGAFMIGKQFMKGEKNNEEVTREVDSNLITRLKVKVCPLATNRNVFRNQQQKAERFLEIA